MIRFLQLEVVLAFHEEQINEYGGKAGIRDINLLKSALAQPEASFGGEYVYSDIFEMAAAYGFHICKYHPFFDGNKRTAFLAMYTFLYVNGWELKSDKKLAYAVVIDLAAGKMTEEELTGFLRNNSKKRK
jgi:death on curing protein